MFHLGFCLVKRRRHNNRFRFNQNNYSHWAYILSARIRNRSVKWETQISPRSLPVNACWICFVKYERPLTVHRSLQSLNQTALDFSSDERGEGMQICKSRSAKFDIKKVKIHLKSCWPVSRSAAYTASHNTELITGINNINANTILYPSNVLNPLSLS